MKFSGGFKMLTLQIKGAQGPERLKDIQEIVGGVHLYRKGTDLEWYADFSNREWANLSMVNLNLIPGIKASILSDPYIASREAPTSR